MKKQQFILLLSIFFFVVQNNYAQQVIDIDEKESKHTISMGISDPVIPSLFIFSTNNNLYPKEIINNIHGDGSNEAKNYNTLNARKYSSLVVFNANYWYKLSKKFHIGAGASFYTNSSKISYVHKNDETKIIDTYTKHYYYTIQARARYDYLQRENLKLYSSLGAGVLFIRQIAGDNNGESTYKDIAPIHSYHISPIGIELGNQVGGFLEAGFSSHGFLQIGVFARF